MALETRKLAAPKLLTKKGDSNTYADERLLKTLPVFSSESLSKVTLLLLHDKYSENEARNSIQNLENCQGKLEMRSARIEKLRINGPLKGESVKNEMMNYLDREGKDPKQVFCITILDRDTDYPHIKRELTALGILSQALLKNTAYKMNLSVASNVMKQINSKLGGESLRMHMPACVTSSEIPPMVIGIDVCHSGKNSVVGFCATTDQSFNHYYSNFLVQKKYQEIIKQDLDFCMDKALKSFKEKNKN